LPPFTITALYRCRWPVEVFFTWITQHLRINAVFGTSENAVKSQRWIAVSVYVLVAIVKKRLKVSASLYEILEILSLTMFERMPLDQLLAQVVADDIDYHLPVHLRPAARFPQGSPHYWITPRVDVSEETEHEGESIRRNLRKDRRQALH
jgi:hypothetical protein